VSNRFALDASAVLCLVRGEPGADIVGAALPHSVISAVNLAEVIAKMVDLGMNADLIDRVLGPLKLQTVAFDAAQALASGLLRAGTRSLGLSLGDRACIALAVSAGATALTTDQAWGALKGIAAISLAR